jgi:hypothetical protein
VAGWAGEPGTGEAGLGAISGLARSSFRSKKSAIISLGGTGLGCIADAYTAMNEISITLPCAVPSVRLHYRLVVGEWGVARSSRRVSLSMRNLLPNAKVEHRGTPSIAGRKIRLRAKGGKRLVSCDASWW